jgi:SAM-dependent methyltransferase
MNTDEYIKLAEVEDRMWYFPAMHWYVQRAFRRAGVGADAHVLDAGCGTGGLSLRLRAAQPSWQMEAIDFSSLAVELAQRRVPGVHFQEASVTALPFPDASFDAVACVDVISQVDDDRGALAELFRVLKPGGHFVTNVPAYMWLWSYHDVSCQTKRRYVRPQLRGLIEAAGFTDVDATYWNALTLPMLTVKRKVFRTAEDTSDVKPYPAALEAVFTGLMGIEHAWVRAGGRWAWGSSIFASARKPSA